MLLHHVSRRPQTLAPPSTPNTHSPAGACPPSTHSPGPQDVPCCHIFLLSFLSPEREGQGSRTHHHPDVP